MKYLFSLLLLILPNLPQAPKQATVMFTGDVIPARSVNYFINKKNDPTWPFKNVADKLKSADLTVINLETPLIEKCPITNEGFKFCGSKKNIEGLVFAGVDIAGLANNHSGNYGIEGIRETIKNLDEAGINSVGGDNINILYKTVNGINFAFLSFNDVGGAQAGIISADEENLKKLIPEAKANSDIVVASFHWGDEYTDIPSERQKTLGRLAIDLGADVVVGNHPHWIQPYEIYKDKYILYALGNFVFDQEWSQKTKEGAIAEFIFENKKITKLQFTPVEISNYGEVAITDNYGILPKKLE